MASYVSLTFFSLGSRGQVPHPPAPPASFLDADLALAFILLVNWLPNVYLSFDPIRTLYHDWFSLLSLLATLPVIWASLTRETNDDSLLMAGDVIFLYPFRFWRLHVSFMRILTPDSNSLFTLHPVTRKATKLGLSIFSTLTTVTAWVHICLYRVQKYYDLSFFDVFYTIAGMKFLQFVNHFV